MSVKRDVISLDEIEVFDRGSMDSIGDQVAVAEWRSRGVSR